METSGNPLITSAPRSGGDVVNTPDPRRWWALALLCGAFFMVVLDATIVLVALPSIQADIGFSEQGLQWVLSAYALTFGGLLLLGGRAADLLGRRRLFMTGVLCFTAASLLCGLAWSPAALVAARVVQGAGAAIMTPTALSIISTTFPEGSERNKALGIWGALGGIGATTAWLIGGPLVDGPGWRWIFFINIPLGLAALALSPVLLRESRAALTRRSYDPAGALTITGALVLLVYAVVEAPDVGWGDVRTILLVAGSAVLLAAFTLIESRHHAPLVPLRIFRSRTLAGANAVTVLIGTVAVGMPFVLTLYAQQVLGYSAFKFGVSSVVLAVGATAGAIAGQAAVLKAGFRWVAATGLALMGAGSLVLTQVFVHGSYFPDIFFGLLLCGLGIGLALVTATVVALAGVAEHEAGLASGLSNTRAGRAVQRLRRLRRYRRFCETIKDALDPDAARPVPRGCATTRCPGRTCPSWRRRPRSSRRRRRTHARRRRTSCSSCWRRCGDQNRSQMNESTPILTTSRTGELRRPGGGS
jgi:EmrB/QacA subfamily drug resistance transporter